MRCESYQIKSNNIIHKPYIPIGLYVTTIGIAVPSILIGDPAIAVNVILDDPNDIEMLTEAAGEIFIENAIQLNEHRHGFPVLKELIYRDKETDSGEDAVISAWLTSDTTGEFYISSSDDDDDDDDNQQDDDEFKLILINGTLNTQIYVTSYSEHMRWRLLDKGDHNSKLEEFYLQPFPLSKLINHLKQFPEVIRKQLWKFCSCHLIMKYGPTIDNRAGVLVDNTKLGWCNGTLLKISSTQNTVVIAKTLGTSQVLFL